MYICVYCAYYSKNIIDFRYRKKDGLYFDSMFQCPSCKAIMRENTIKMNMNVYDWVEYLYLNIRVTDGYFEKVKFEEYFKHLKELNVGKDFWDYWKLFKERCSGKSKQQLFSELLTLITRLEYNSMKQVKFV